jgi:hypothetical protein
MTLWQEIGLVILTSIALVLWLWVKEQEKSNDR